MYRVEFGYQLEYLLQLLYQYILLVTWQREDNQNDFRHENWGYEVREVFVSSHGYILYYVVTSERVIFFHLLV